MSQPPGVFSRGRAGSNVVWRGSPTRLSSFADQSTVPLRECLAGVFSANHADEPEVDPADIEHVYDSLAASERIVGGYTKFSVDAGQGMQRMYSTSNPDAVEEAPRPG
eukprot:CAMPEP_0197606008 /NCGR_PEP_ID=MMETSP1326-20131121/44198_1 /TAXON_ID=1155430 /ORGANISM="Genus nov. species nov., Strain RCC2288" /LENGTH=107 /DNA_ID=CAMNT_0043173861 /DNA_START=261 /DNA_END=580 /DNA_ORIENTATION=-